jgi:hypothetical protein
MHRSTSPLGSLIVPKTGCTIAVPRKLAGHAPRRGSYTGGRRGALSNAPQARP